MHATGLILNCGFIAAFLWMATGRAEAAQGWVQSYKAGYTDASPRICAQRLSKRLSQFRAP